jgi:hypothetical protein
MGAGRRACGWLLTITTLPPLFPQTSRIEHNFFKIIQFVGPCPRCGPLHGVWVVDGSGDPCPRCGKTQGVWVVAKHFRLATFAQARSGLRLQCWECGHGSRVVAWCCLLFHPLAGRSMMGEF